HAVEWRDQVRAVLAEARAMYQRETGKRLTNFHRSFKDADSTLLPGFERMARTLADRSPGFLGAHGYERGGNDSTAAAEKLWELLTAGVPRVSKDAAYKEAHSLLGFFSPDGVGAASVETF